MVPQQTALTQRAVSTKRKPRRWLRGLILIMAVFVIAVGGLVAVPIVSPATGAVMADWLRGIIGPEAVANIESVAFQLEDIFNRARYQASGGQAQLSFADDPAADKSAVPSNAAPKPAANAAPAPVPATVDRAAGGTLASPSNRANPVPANEAAPLDNSWAIFGPTYNNATAFARTTDLPDPTRAYAKAAIVRIDLSLVNLHLLPGTQEPVAVKGVPALARTGMIPSGVQASGQLLAAFNGGFKTIHGHYGVMIDGVTLLPPIDNLATLALYKDGSLKLGAWGRDIVTDTTMIAFRQNCPLLIDEGEINPHVNDESRQEWGYTVKNLDTTWRSGVGLSRDGRYLYYATGNSLTVQSLAQALKDAGAYYAMQLDINGFYTRFVTYRPADNPKALGHPIQAYKLLNEMSGDPALFLHPYDRDFFYITTKATA